ncbi:hypothetical protein DFH06DRAFT_1346221 [Mycena polygramma]|nr:hypothetical protein DFH06DRAFT_1346221 [Mycena polygramma]
MSYDMSNPEERAMANARRDAGIGPTLGPQQESRKRRRARAEEIYQQRSGLVHTDEAERRKRVAYLEHLRYGPRAPRLSPMSGLVNLADIRRADLAVKSTPSKDKPAATVIKSTTQKRVRYDYDDPECGFVRETDAVVPVFYREPDWSEASDDDEYDPAGGLPYMPRWNISTRRANAMIVVAAREAAKEAQVEVERKRAAGQRREAKRVLVQVLAQIREVGAESRFVEAAGPRREAKRMMVQVLAQIREVGAQRRLVEKAEIGPAPHGFQDDVFLALVGGEGSLIHVGTTQSVIIFQSYKFPNLNMCRAPHEIHFHCLTDGEAPERGWAYLGPLANNAREMGPGVRRDVLEDSNWDWGARGGNRAERRRRILEERKVQRRALKSGK